MKWALVIHENQDLVDNLGYIVQNELGRSDLRAVTARDFGAASDKLRLIGRDDCQIVIAAFSTPADASQPPPLEGDYKIALAFVQEQRRLKPDLPFIFLPRILNSATQSVFFELPNVRLVEMKGYSQTLAPVINDLLLPERPDCHRPPHDVDLTIRLILGGGCNWHMRGPKGSALDDVGSFDINDEQLDSLIEFSNEAVARHSPYMIKEVGKKMYELLFQNNVTSDGLEPALRQNIHSANGNYLEAARFHFHLDSETNQLLVEALAKPSRRRTPKVDYWMLSAPIYRKYEGHGERHPLFKDRASQTESIDCLIIQGQADAFVAAPPVGKDFPAIELARKEVTDLTGYLTSRKAAFKINEIRVMRPELFPEKAYGKEVLRTLGERHWHLIHYAGHSTIVDEHGYLVLGNGAADALDIDVFSRNARGTQFVFLNSCSSADGVFIARLVEKNIPAVVGYAWPLEDVAALEFSRKFYDELFNGEKPPRFLEYSFMRGKAHLYDRFKNQSAWAAPMLFMQTSESDRG